MLEERRKIEDPFRRSPLKIREDKGTEVPAASNRGDVGCGAPAPPATDLVDGLHISALIMRSIYDEATMTGHPGYPKPSDAKTEVPLDSARRVLPGEMCAGTIKSHSGRSR